jgi:hypothetical protein
MSNAFNDGYEAFKKGLGYFDNPHMDRPGEETAMRVWVDGYVRALIDARNATESA